MSSLNLLKNIGAKAVTYIKMEDNSETLQWILRIYVTLQSFLGKIPHTTITITCTTTTIYSV